VVGTVHEQSPGGGGEGGNGGPNGPSPSKRKGGREGGREGGRAGEREGLTLLSSVSHIWTAMSLATFTCASSVLAPKWGVHETLGWAKSFLVLSPGGSFSYTSKAAPPT